MAPPELDAGNKHDAAAALSALGIAALLLIPVAAPDWFPNDPARSAVWRILGTACALLLPAVAVLVAWRIPIRASGAEKRVLFLLLGLLALLATDLHYSNVEHGKYFSGDRWPSNIDWQREVQHDLLRLDTDWIPHSYRFLPNCIVAWLSQLTGNFLVASLVFRLTLQFALLIAIYHYARLWVDHRRGLVVVFLYMIAYPITLRYYAGQLTDPVSHLTFVLTFLFMELGRPWLFFATVVIGVLAKESILAMPVYYLLVHLRDRARWLPGLATLFAAGGLAVAVRLIVAGEPEYEKISGVGPEFLVSNFLDYWFWGRQFWHTLGFLMPLMALRWRQAPSRLRMLILFLVPVLWLSNLCFSYLRESRNYVPVLIPCAVIASMAILRDEDPPETKP